jgi:hypothetical protein
MVSEKTEQSLILRYIKKALKDKILKLREGNEEYLFLEWVPESNSEKFDNPYVVLKDFVLTVNMAETNPEDLVYQNTLLEVEYDDGETRIPICDIPLDEEFFVDLFTAHAAEQLRHKERFTKALNKIVKI